MQVKGGGIWKKSTLIFHWPERETPVPVFVGLKVYALTRKRQLIDALFSFGLSDSYDRVMDIVTTMGNHISKYYDDIGVVCPPQLRNATFTTGAVDNIDHNPS